MNEATVPVEITTGPARRTAMDRWADRHVDLRPIAAIARKEVRDALRNRWFVLYAIAFAALALALSALSLVGSGTAGFAGFGRTAASLINLVILIVPLMALTAGATAIAGERERGTLTCLLAQPLTPLEVMLGKYLGLGTALAAALAIGFGASAAVIASRAGPGEAGRFVRLVGLTFLLALAMLSVGLLISTLARRSSAALGAAIFTWLGLVFFGDLGLMGSAVVFKLQVAQLFRASLVNPLEVFRLGSLLSLDASLDLLGPAGLYATRTWGAGLGNMLTGVLAAWAVLPLVPATLLFTRRGAT